jgi:hypothetical protein
MWTTFLNLLLQLLAWVSGRPLLAVRIIDDDSDRDVGGLQFEIENRSKNAVSLQPQIKFTCWHLVNGSYRKASTTYDVRELDRTLPPFTPKLLTASSRQYPAKFLFSWFRTYKFIPTRGPSTKVRIRNALMEPLSLWQCFIEEVKFRTKGEVTDSGPLNMREHEVKKRSRGPH